MLKKREKVLLYLIAFSFAVYFISTLLKNAFLIDLFSPITVGLVLILLISELKRLGQFKWSSVAMALGIFLWFVGDILFLLNDFVFPDSELLSATTEFIYMLPNGCLAACITIYMLYKLSNSRIEMAFLLANSLCFAISFFVLILRLHLYASDDTHDHIHWTQLIFFFVSFYVMMMCFELAIHIGIKNIFKGPFITNIGVFCYSALDIRYNFLLAQGIDAESDFTNLLYIVFIIFMGVGTTFQIIKNYDFEFRKRDFSKKATRSRFVFILCMILVDIIMISTSFLPQSLGMYILITLLSYLITNYALHSQYLNEELINSQKEQNAKLEERIKEKTQDLESANDQLHVLSSTDALTGLLNRRSATEYIEKMIGENASSNEKFAVFCTDLNHFKPVNDTYGHEMGDEVLKEIGKRLGRLPSDYRAFRMGGDEFLIILNGISDISEAENAADSIRKLFNTPIIFDNYIFNLSASIGVAIYPDDATTLGLLLNYADNAMYMVKKSGNKDGCKFFDVKMSEQISRKQLIRKTVENAAPDKDYVLHYQPQVDADSGEILGVEVFPHLKGDMENVSPADLIPVAEECGVLSALGIWIVRDSFETVSKWNKKYGANIALTINLAPQQMIDAEFIEALERLSAEFELDVKKIILDISTDIMMESSSSSRDTLEAFHHYGFKLSLNDFGGSSINLAYVMTCGVNYIKLSRNLISSAETDETMRILIESITGLASAMGITIAAVGVENEAQYQLLRQMGIKKMQGYLFSRPVRAEELDPILQKGIIPFIPS
jgi:diguanylate cyclase (GGDEF)-like protein